MLLLKRLQLKSKLGATCCTLMLLTLAACGGSDNDTQNHTPVVSNPPISTATAAGLPAPEQLPPLLIPPFRSPYEIRTIMSSDGSQEIGRFTRLLNYPGLGNDVWRHSGHGLIIGSDMTQHALAHPNDDGVIYPDARMYCNSLDARLMSVQEALEFREAFGAEQGVFAQTAGQPEDWDDVQNSVYIDQTGFHRVPAGYRSAEVAQVFSDFRNEEDPALSWFWLADSLHFTHPDEDRQGNTAYYAAFNIKTGEISSFGHRSGLKVRCVRN